MFSRDAYDEEGHLHGHTKEEFVDREKREAFRPIGRRDGTL
jgi:hypothetical protein